MWKLILWSTAGHLLTVEFFRETDADTALAAFKAALAGSDGVKVKNGRG